MKLNPIEKSEYIYKKYKEYLMSTFTLGNGKLQKLFHNQLDSEKLFKGPYIDMVFPFERGKSINKLIEQGVICKSFKKLSNIDFDRPLYFHQEEAIKKIKNGRSVVITTGTGSGKTESFLYPILNEILSEIENGNREIGIRAIFLYPMNALINDQFDRIRSILSDCPDITYGFYTSETPEEKDKSKTDKSNEIKSREEIRENPPHLIFTNYAMLEYLLIRPGDYSIFEPKKLNNWKYVVLDEAHTYRGSSGIEISLLMRRLVALSAKNPKFILTSATLGSQGKSEEDILKFANNLTSVDFKIDDIIFSKRINNSYEYFYSVDGPDYIRIKESLDDLENIKQIAGKYINNTSSDISEIIFNLLSKDKNVYDLSRLLKDGSKDFYFIFDKMKNILTKDELISLIEILNFSEKDGIKLFDLKYHSFVRPVSGAYITCDNNPQLSLVKTNFIDEKKAFEVGNCRYCGAPYIVGKIYKKNSNNLEYFYQNNEVDIYDNYGDNSSVSLDFLLLDNFFNDNKIDNILDTDEFENNLIEKEAYEICSKCGEIHSKSNLNAKKCECENTLRFTAYKIIQKNKDEEKIYNNINRCPCCGHKSKSGIVKLLNIGKDEGTAIIGQILYETLEEEKIENEKIGEKIELNLNKIREKRKAQESKDIKIKQYLVFSDSRQEASFSAVFFDHNHTRFLRKRLIWEIIKLKNYSDFKVNDLVSLIRDRIKTADLFDNNLDSQKNAWLTVLVDLLKVDGSYDGESMGLYYFDLDINGIMDELSDEDIYENFEGLNMTKEKLYTFIQVVMSIFKTRPAINYSSSTLVAKDVEQVLEYRRYNNYVMMKMQENKKPDYNSVYSFIPVKNTNYILRYTMKAFDVNEEKAKNALELIFSIFEQYKESNNIYDNIFIKHDKENSYQINANKYIVKNYKNSKYYKCNKCGRLTPYNINNKCVQDKCLGSLIEVDPDKELKQNYYRNKYMNKNIERVVIKEHTAQLNKKQAREYQKDFRDKKINILSCSTTFEMGIDIGNLETVFMRNVPPTPANYVQRAGRAGRRKDSSAYVLTYCNSKSHDYTYFQEPYKMISGIIEPPIFNINNRKIVIRHLTASCLGYFFRKYPEYFKNLDKFIITGCGYIKFIDYVKSKPAELEEYINKKILNEKIYEEYRDFKWFDELYSKDGKLTLFVESIRGMISEFEEGKKEALKKYSTGESNDSKFLGYYDKQIENLKGKDKCKNIINYLSTNSIIPKYGFPVDVVELKVYEDGKILDDYEMTRDLKIAISEYAPDSEVIVDGNKYTSKYITVDKYSEFTKNWFTTCPLCNKLNIFLNYRDNLSCKYCGSDISTNISEYFIEPKRGFKVGTTKKSTRLKPKKSYSGEVYYIGNGNFQKNSKLGDIIEVQTSSDDELFLKNKSKFYMCPKCGYSDIVKGGNVVPKILKKHKNFRENDCECEELECIHLGHKFKTDVAIISIPKLTKGDGLDYSKAISFLYALIEGVSMTLGIDRDDIDGILEVNLNLKSYNIILYDNVSGGAGNVKRLIDKDILINSLKNSLKKVSSDCCDENTSCYNCLRNYYNQSYHGILQRKMAKDTIEYLLGEMACISGVSKNVK